MLGVHVTAANEQNRAQVQQLVQPVQAVTGHLVEPGHADQGYTGDQPTQDAAAPGIQLEFVKLPQARKGFVLLPPSLGGRAQFRLGQAHPALGP